MEHFYKSVEGHFGFPTLYTRMVNEAKDNAVFVEVGSFKGQSAAYMAVEIINSGKYIEFCCVDTWLGSPGEHGDDQDVKNGTLYKKFIENTEPVREYIATYVGESVKMSKEFDDESLDFVFIDAAHDYKSVCDDINAWLPKVKSGGYIGGHDYRNGCQVVKAVKDTIGEIEIVDGDSWLYRKQ